MSTWDLLRNESLERGLSQLREAYARKPNASHIMELGVAYLWAGDFRTAANHFQQALKNHPHTTSGFYGMAGVARWCLDEPNVAVEQWHTGLGAQYADTAGAGIHLPLLLYVASVLKPEVFFREKAEQILATKVEDPRVNSWPGPLAQLVLGMVNDTTLAEHCIGNTGRNQRGFLPHRKRLVEFYKAITEFSRGKMDLSGLKEVMRRTADTTQAEWTNENAFLSLLWSEEFFIARHEASVAP